ncbi:MAG: type I-D CRISPR-associated protein Cas7/Csc2 [Candidatus Sericytochromatia bacterium]
MTVLNNYKDFFVDNYTNFPKGKYINIVIVRKTESETIFRTEGSGEPLNREYISAGKENKDIIARSIISKRKQTAVERRTGREILRNYDLLKFKDKKGVESECTLNTNSPCEKCPDCMIYGFAVGGGGAQKARVITEDAFSILPINLITDTKTFNATYDNGTMRSKDEKGKEIISSSLGSSEYIKPETHFIDIEVLKDVTQNDLLYVLGNILRSTRYGAMTSRIGKVHNEIINIIFSDTEIFSTLELTQAVYDDLTKEKKDLDFPLQDNIVFKSVSQESTKLAENEVFGKFKVMSSDDLNTLNNELKTLYSNPQEFLKSLSNSYKGE